MLAHIDLVLTISYVTNFLPLVFLTLFFRNNRSNSLKVFFIYIISYAILIGLQLLLRYLIIDKNIYFISIRVQLALEFCLLVYFFQLNFKNNLVRKIAFIIAPLFLIYSVYDYIKSSKTKFGADQAIVECLFMLLILIYFFFEKIKYEVKTPLYEFKVFWIAVAFFIFFSGNFFLLIYSKTMINDPSFREQYIYIYSTFNIIKNGLLCVAIIIKNNIEKSIITDSPFESFYPFNNQD